MKPAISIFMDSNERGSGRDTALALACGSNPDFDLAGFAELDVDMRLETDNPAWIEVNGERVVLPKLACNIELKEIGDFWSSKNTGHLGQQILTMLGKGEPGFVAVFGSLETVLAGVPKMKSIGAKPRPRSQMDIASDVSTARAFCADAVAANVPVHFLSSNQEQSFKWILSYAKHILEGPSLSSWLPRFSADAPGYGCLCSVPGIGHETATGLLAAHGSISRIVDYCKLNPEVLTNTSINGKALGKAKVSRLMKAFGCE